MGILAYTAFEITSTVNKSKGYNPVQLIFGHDMMILIQHVAYWELLCQKKKGLINK